MDCINADGIMKWTKTHTIIAVVVVLIVVAMFWPTNNRYLKKLADDKTDEGL